MYTNNQCYFSIIFKNIIVFINILEFLYFQFSEFCCAFVMFYIYFLIYILKIYFLCIFFIIHFSSLTSTYFILFYLLAKAKFAF